jgi:hypothetical protein
LQSVMEFARSSCRNLNIIIIINCKWVFTRWQWYNNKTTDKIQAYYNKTTYNIYTRQQTITQDNRQL